MFVFIVSEYFQLYRNFHFI